MPGQTELYQGALKTVEGDQGRVWMMLTGV